MVSTSRRTGSSHDIGGQDGMSRLPNGHEGRTIHRPKTSHSIQMLPDSGSGI